VDDEAVVGQPALDDLGECRGPASAGERIDDQRDRTDTGYDSTPA